MQDELDTESLKRKKARERDLRQLDLDNETAALERERRFRQLADEVETESQMRKKARERDLRQIDDDIETASFVSKKAMMANAPAHIADARMLVSMGFCTSQVADVLKSKLLGESQGDTTFFVNTSDAAMPKVKLNVGATPR